MIVLIILTFFALAVLTLGFLGIKIPFVSVKKEFKPKETPLFKQSTGVTDRLVKDSIQHTIRSTKLLKESIKGSAVLEKDE